ncbi:MAG: alpha/beta hydrolase [Thermomicrobiales bacterium]
MRRLGGVWRSTLGLLIVMGLLGALLGLTPAQIAAATPTVVIPTAGTPATATPAAGGALPHFEPGACAYPPAPEVAQAVRCGTVVVPESHAHPNGKTIRLPVLVYRAANPNPAPEPIVLLSGGPGQSGAVFVSYLTGPRYAALAAHNDLIVFDQRGTGKAQPNLNCTEVQGTGTRADDARLKALAAPTFTDLMLQCRDRLEKSGVDLATYTTTENAADVNDIRAALGYAKMNLYGASYGSELGLAIARDFPQYVRASALGSIVPLQTPFFAEQAVNFDRALTELFATCAADAHCNATYPDLKGTFQRAVATFDANPLIVPLKNPQNGQTVNFPMTGRTYAVLVFQLLYTTDLLAYMPDIITQAANGNTTLLAVLLSSALGEGGLAYGMHFSITCTHSTSDARKQAMLAAEQQILPEAREALEQTELLYFAVCPQWPSQGADPNADQPAASSVPTLLVSGQFDPITPPAYARQAASALPHSFVVDLPDAGHSATFALGPVGQCGQQVVLTFLAHPDQGPDQTCLGQLPPFQFTTLPAELTGPAATPTPRMPGLPNTGAGGKQQSADLPLALVLGALALLFGGLAWRRALRR